MKHIWDKRYNEDKYAYGVHPNVFFREKIQHLKPGRLLLPAEGEGRNAVYAAALGWDVYAFDFSSKAREKALQLSKQKKVDIRYEVHSIEEANYEADLFDVVAIIYAHSPNRMENHKHLIKFLKPGGLVILEAFSKTQINNNSGGPNNINMLYSVEELKDDFSALSELNVWEEDIVLDEGTFHNGRSSVIRLIGEK